MENTRVTDYKLAFAPILPIIKPLFPCQEVFSGLEIF